MADCSRAVDRAAIRKTNARAVDRFAGEPDDELTGKGRASGSFSAVSHRTRLSFRQSGAAMGIYDREYYRGETGGSGWFSGVSPVCKSIIGINVAVFLLEQLINRGITTFIRRTSPRRRMASFIISASGNC